MLIWIHFTVERFFDSFIEPVMGKVRTGTNRRTMFLLTPVSALTAL